MLIKLAKKVIEIPWSVPIKGYSTSQASIGIRLHLLVQKTKQKNVYHRTIMSYNHDRYYQFAKIHIQTLYETIQKPSHEVNNRIVALERSVATGCLRLLLSCVIRSIKSVIYLFIPLSAFR